MLSQILILAFVIYSKALNFGWSLNEDEYKSKLLTIVGNSSKMRLDIPKNINNNPRPVFGNSLKTDILPFRNLGAFIVLVNTNNFTRLEEKISNCRFTLEIGILYENKGYLLYLSPEALAWILDQPEVYLVEEDLRIEINNFLKPTCNIPWGLDRIDPEGLIDCQYNIGDLTGLNSHLYITDTGILTNHQEFIGRLGNGISFVEGDKSTSDCNGHGTHIAGTAAGTKYGVAKKAILHSVKVMNCQGYGFGSWLLNGLEWIKRDVKSNGITTGVVSISLASSNSESQRGRRQYEVRFPRKVF